MNLKNKFIDLTLKSHIEDSCLSLDEKSTNKSQLLKRALFLLQESRNIYMENSFELSLECFLKTKTFIEKCLMSFPNDIDFYNVKCFTITQISLLYKEKGLFEEARDELQNFYSELKSIKEIIFKLDIGYFFSEFALIYQKLYEEHKCLVFCKKAIIFNSKREGKKTVISQIYSISKNTNLLSESNYILAKSLIQKKFYEEAKEYLENAINNSSLNQKEDLKKYKKLMRNLYLKISFERELTGEISFSKNHTESSKDFSSNSLQFNQIPIEYYKKDQFKLNLDSVKLQGNNLAKKSLFLTHREDPKKYYFPGKILGKNSPKKICLKNISSALKNVSTAHSKLVPVSSSHSEYKSRKYKTIQTNDSIINTSIKNYQHLSHIKTEKSAEKTNIIDHFSFILNKRPQNFQKPLKRVQTPSEKMHPQNEDLNLITNRSLKKEVSVKNDRSIENISEKKSIIRKISKMNTYFSNEEPHTNGKRPSRRTSLGLTRRSIADNGIQRNKILLSSQKSPVSKSVSRVSKSESSESYSSKSSSKILKDISSENILKSNSVIEILPLPKYCLFKLVLLLMHLKKFVRKVILQKKQSKEKEERVISNKFKRPSVLLSFIRNNTKNSIQNEVKRRWTCETNSEEFFLFEKINTSFSSGNFWFYYKSFQIEISHIQINSLKYKSELIIHYKYRNEVGVVSLVGNSSHLGNNWKKAKQIIDSILIQNKVETLQTNQFQFFLKNISLNEESKKENEEMIEFGKSLKILFNHFLFRIQKKNGYSFSFIFEKAQGILLESNFQTKKKRILFSKSQQKEYRKILNNEGLLRLILGYGKQLHSFKFAQNTNDSSRQIINMHSQLRHSNTEEGNIHSHLKSGPKRPKILVHDKKEIKGIEEFNSEEDFNLREKSFSLEVSLKNNEKKNTNKNAPFLTREKLQKAFTKISKMNNFLPSYFTKSKMLRYYKSFYSKKATFKPSLIRNVFFSGQILSSHCVFKERTFLVVFISLSYDGKIDLVSEENLEEFSVSVTLEKFCGRGTWNDRRTYSLKSFFQIFLKLDIHFSDFFQNGGFSKVQLIFLEKSLKNNLQIEKSKIAFQVEFQSETSPMNQNEILDRNDSFNSYSNDISIRLNNFLNDQNISLINESTLQLSLSNDLKVSKCFNQLIPFANPNKYYRIKENQSAGLLRVEVKNFRFFLSIYEPFNNQKAYYKEAKDREAKLVISILNLESKKLCGRAFHSLLAKEYFMLGSKIVFKRDLIRKDLINVLELKAQHFLNADTHYKVTNFYQKKNLYLTFYHHILGACEASFTFFIPKFVNLDNSPFLHIRVREIKHRSKTHKLIFGIDDLWKSKIFIKGEENYNSLAKSFAFSQLANTKLVSFGGPKKLLFEQRASMFYKKFENYLIPISNADSNQRTILKPKGLVYKTVAQFVMKSNGHFLTLTIQRHFFMNHYSLNIYFPFSCRNFTAIFSFDELSGLSEDFTKKYFNFSMEYLLENLQHRKSFEDFRLLCKNLSKQRRNSVKDEIEKLEQRNETIIPFLTQSKRMNIKLENFIEVYVIEFH